jgi:hypothetical protein
MARHLVGMKKGKPMSNQSPMSRTLIAAAAAIMMSVVTVGAAVGPAQAVAAPVKVAINA